MWEQLEKVAKQYAAMIAKTSPLAGELRAICEAAQADHDVACAGFRNYCDKLEKEIAELKERLADRESMLPKLQNDCDKLESKLKAANALYDHALKCVDKVFKDGYQRFAILPGFCRAGEDKFEAVVNLARGYKALKDRLDAVEQPDQDAIRVEAMRACLDYVWGKRKK